MKQKIFLSWSSGKDSAWSLQTLRQQQIFELAGLVTTINSLFQRVAMHAVRIELLKKQAEMLEIPLHIIPIPHPCSNDIYEAAFKTFINEQMRGKIEYLAFGDLFLEEVRTYRETLLHDTGVQALFPLWLEPTHMLARKMVASGLKAHITCINPKQLDRRFATYEYDNHFLNALPQSVDPCGENGEFHTFVYDGPMFKKPIPVIRGEIVEREEFIFTDILIDA